MSSCLVERTLTPVAVALCGLVLALSACGQGQPRETSAATYDSTTSSSELASTSTMPESFEDVWTASVAAVDALGPVRVQATRTTEGRVLDEDAPPEWKEAESQTTEVEELLDTPGKRARLTIHESDGIVRTVVVQGRERTTVLSDTIVSVERYVSLEEPDGLPLPLWAGVPPPNLGYADLLGGTEHSGGPLIEGGSVEQLSDGGRMLSWEQSNERGSSSINLLLSEDLLPVRIEQHGEGELEGVMIAYSSTIEYQFEQVASFSDSDFALDLPADAWREAVTYELPLDRPTSERADWGQYWLGEQVGEWLLVQAWHGFHQDNPDLGEGAEPSDEHIWLRYRRPGAESPNEDIQVYVRPLRGRYLEDSRTFAEQRVASGDWQKKEMTVAGQPATAYSGALEGKPSNRADTIDLFLPDAFVTIQLWAPVDPQLVLDSLQPLE